MQVVVRNEDVECERCGTLTQQGLFGAVTAGKHQLVCADCLLLVCREAKSPLVAIDTVFVVELPE
jgi:late competence protein required for DNA uptake (superfamily II DNA/RNA helicase)